jgi:hypothetical protein
MRSRIPVRQRRLHLPIGHRRVRRDLRRQADRSLELRRLRDGLSARSRLQRRRVHLEVPELEGTMRRRVRQFDE